MGGFFGEFLMLAYNLLDGNKWEQIVFLDLKTIATLRDFNEMVVAELSALSHLELDVEVSGRAVCYFGSWQQSTRGNMERNHGTDIRMVQEFQELQHKAEGSEMWNPKGIIPSAPSLHSPSGFRRIRYVGIYSLRPLPLQRFSKSRDLHAMVRSPSKV